MREWLKTDPEWALDEDAFCRWLARINPEFFTHGFPFIGYIRFRLEGMELTNQVVLRSLSGRMSRAVSGLTSISKKGKGVDNEHKWHFELDE